MQLTTEQRILCIEIARQEQVQKKYNVPTLRRKTIAQLLNICEEMKIAKRKFRKKDELVQRIYNHTANQPWFQVWLNQCQIEATRNDEDAEAPVESNENDDNQPLECKNDDSSSDSESEYFDEPETNRNILIPAIDESQNEAEAAQEMNNRNHDLNNDEEQKVLGNEPLAGEMMNGGESHNVANDDPRNAEEFHNVANDNPRNAEDEKRQIEVACSPQPVEDNPIRASVVHNANEIANGGSNVNLAVVDGRFDNVENNGLNVPAEIRRASSVDVNVEIVNDNVVELVPPGSIQRDINDALAQEPADVLNVQPHAINSFLINDEQLQLNQPLNEMHDNDQRNHVNAANLVYGAVIQDFEDPPNDDEVAEQPMRRNFNDGNDDEKRGNEQNGRFHCHCVALNVRNQGFSCEMFKMDIYCTIL